MEISARFCNKKYSFDFTGENPGLSDCFVLEGAAAWSVATPNLYNVSAEISLDELKAYMKKCAKKPVRESIMTQFREMDDAPVESKLFWKESKEYLAEEYAKGANK